MSDPYIGEIRLFAFNYAPAGWLTCSGQFVQIAQASALYSILGTYYGGDGTRTFALPNLQGRVIVGAGQGVGLSSYAVGEAIGQPEVTLLQNNLAPHSHSFSANTQQGSTRTSASSQLSRASGGVRTSPSNAALYNPTAPNVAMSAMAVNLAGGGQPHNNLQPFLCMTYCISMQGAFPPRQ